MPIEPDALAALASDYAKGMTSIRGRRVQRLLKREFAGAEHVVVVQRGCAVAAVLGVSATGAAFCATDGRGPHAVVVKWLHEATQAVETRFDLLKDSLPVLGTRPVALAGRLLGQSAVSVDRGSLPLRARALADRALRALE
jgi:hypothetical protein